MYYVNDMEHDNILGFGITETTRLNVSRFPPQTLLKPEDVK